MKRVGDLGAAFRGDGNQRRERDHRVGGAAAHIDITDVFGLAAVVGLGLHVDAEQAAETVEVVDVAAAHARRQRLKRFVDRHAELARLLAVEIHLDLGVVRVERGEEVAELRPLARRVHELAGVVAELLHA